METKQSFSLRKLSVGLASVLIGISFLNGTKANVVKADTEESPKENVQDAQDKNSEDMQAAILKNTSSQNVDAQNTTQTDNLNVDSGTSAVQVGQVAGAERGDSSARETRTSQLEQVNSNKSTRTSQLELDTNNVNSAVLTKLALNPSRTKTLNLQSLKESKIAANTTNGGFDSSWGTLDVNAWQGSVQGNYYQLTNYTGDVGHVIVPNEADFEKAGISTSGKQVGVTSNLMHTIFRDNTTAQDATVAFSKTNNKMVKAINNNWFDTWGHIYYYDSKAKLSKFDGTNLDVSNVTDMGSMFYNNQISDLSPLANWDTSKVTNMRYMFHDNKISDLSPLANWDTSKVTNMSYMFRDNKISDLSPLANWNTDNVTNMSYMFDENQISDLSPLANWNTDNVTNMSCMFDENQISDLSPLAGWNTDNVTNMSNMFSWNNISDLSPLASWKTDNMTNMSWMFSNNQISDLRPLANWNVNNVTNMSGMFGGFRGNRISDLSPLANWNVNNVTDMSYMFGSNQISDLSPLAGWNVNNVTDMSYMFRGNQISDLSPLANWNVNNVTNMSYMFRGNQISDLSPLAGWHTDNVTNMDSMFNNNQISDLSPLANWKTDNVTSMDLMFKGNKISDLSSLTNWKTDNVTDMASMFDDNQIRYADFTKWNFDQVKYFGNFIKQTNYAIILVKNVQDQTKLVGESQFDQNYSGLYPVVDAPSNNLHFGDTDTSAMPTILIATDKPEARQQLLSLINAKVSDYQKSHPDDKVTPAVSLDNLIELTDLANAKFNVVPIVTTVTVRFIDDTDNLHAPKDYQLANQKMNATLNSSNLKDDQDLANFKFVSEPVFTVTSLNPIWTVHLVHGLIEVTDPNQLQTTSTRTIVFNLPDKPETIVQTIGYKRTGMQDLITKQITYTNWVLDANRSNVTVDQQLSSLYAAYDPNSVSEDGTLVNFAPIKIPTKAGYKPVLQTVRPNMLSFIFMPIAKPPVEVNLDTPEKFSANDATVSLLPTWHLVENNMPDYTYTLTNTINSLNLPKIKDYKLYLVNKESQDNTVAFTYLKDNNLKYLFKIKFINDAFEFSVKNVDKDVISVYKFNNLKDLDKFLVEFVTAA